MTIQGINFTKGTKFSVGDSNCIYTFISVTRNERFGFDELVCENEFDSISSFRIDNMIEHGLIIKLVF